MASPPPRIHGFGDLGESFSLTSNGKYSEYDAYLIAVCRISGRPLAAGDDLDQLDRVVHAHATFLPGCTYPHPGAKPLEVLLDGRPLAPAPGPSPLAWHPVEAIAGSLRDPPRWQIKGDDGVLDHDSLAQALQYPDPYLLTAAPAELPVARTFDLEVTAERAQAGGSGLPPADLVVLAVTHHMPREPPRAHAVHRFEQRYPGPVAADMLVLATRIEHLFPDKPPNYAPGPASAVVRAVRFTDVLVKPAVFDPERAQRWRLVTVVESEVPLTWRAD